MKLVAVAVKDLAVGAFMRPFFVQSRGVANRSFADEVNNAESPMNKHPEDYELYELGSFDEESGRLAEHEDGAPVLLSRGKDVHRG